MIRQLTIACALLSFAMASNAQPDIDRAEAVRSVDQGRVVYAKSGVVTDERMAAAWPELVKLKRGAFKATIVYLHGCDGINMLSHGTADILASAGYLVLMPDDFTRHVKPTSCEPRAFRGGLDRGVLAWRHQDADEALRRAKSLAAVDPSNMFLYGLSEGAIAAATYEGQPVRGRVIEAWTCHAGWPEYRGLQARPEEAVLTLTSQNDPWFQDPVLRGDCGEFLGPSSRLRESLVFRPPHPAASSHDLLWNLDARQAVLGFLDAASRDVANMPSSSH